MAKPGFGFLHAGVIFGATLLWSAAASGQGLALNPNAPASTPKLIFLHHSTGENWLNDDNGALGIALRDANYFVSDTNYGWGPDSIGDTTDIGHWYNWFSGASRDTYMAAVYAESGQNCTYSRLTVDPGGTNQIVMFKSCFPNSALGGTPTDPVPAIGDNPLRGQDAYSPDHTVANAKGIYIELLNYFAAHPEKLFVVITAPPLWQSDTTPSQAANARAFNTWLATEWLVGYSRHNVFVFDFYNVLTSNGGSTRINNPNLNDLGWADGNHHRYSAGAIQWIQTVTHNYSAYWTGDSHPSQAGNLKATGEFVQLLNVAYHGWAGDGGCPRWPSSTPLRVPYGTVPVKAMPVSGSADVVVTWDASLCASTNYHILYGYGSGLASWQTSGSVCAIGTTGQYTWSSVPNPSGDASRFLWFLVAGDNGASMEGSWGLTSAGAERGGATASGRCGCSAKSLAGSCGAL